MNFRASAFHANLSWERFVPSWPLIIGFFGFAIAMSSLALLNDPDTYLHITAGRWILGHLALPFADPFSHSLPGAPWVPHEWLAEAILAAGFELGDWGAIRLITALCFAISLAVFTHSLLRRLDPLSSLFIALATVWLLLPHLLARPHILALPLLVIWCDALIAARDASRAPPIWLLPIMTLWANLHGGFMFGLALAVFLGAEAVLLAGTGQRRAIEAGRWSGFAALSVLAALATPNGLAGLLQPFHLISTPMLPVIIEWQSTKVADFPVLEFWLLGAVGLGFASGFRLPLTRLLLTLGMFHLALAHVRHIDLLAIVVPLATATALSVQIRDKLRTIPGIPLSDRLGRLAGPVATPGIAVLLALVFAVAGVAMLRPIDRSGDSVTPAAALAAARSLGVSRPVFNAYNYGGYLSFEGVPVLIDGRLEMYGNAFFARYLKAVDGDEKTLVDMLDEYRIGWTILRPYDGAVAVFDRLPGWHRAYTDSQALIHIRTEPATAETPPSTATP